MKIGHQLGRPSSKKKKEKNSTPRSMRNARPPGLEMGQQQDGAVAVDTIMVAVPSCPVVHSCRKSKPARWLTLFAFLLATNNGLPVPGDSSKKTEAFKKKNLKDIHFDSILSLPEPGRGEEARGTVLTSSLLASKGDDSKVLYKSDTKDFLREMGGMLKPIGKSLSEKGVTDREMFLLFLYFKKMSLDGNIEIRTKILESKIIENMPNNFDKLTTFQKKIALSIFKYLLETDEDTELGNSKDSSQTEEPEGPIKENMSKLVEEVVKCLDEKEGPVPADTSLSSLSPDEMKTLEEADIGFIKGKSFSVKFLRFLLENDITTELLLEKDVLSVILSSFQRLVKEGSEKTGEEWFEHALFFHALFSGNLIKNVYKDKVSNKHEIVEKFLEIVKEVAKGVAKNVESEKLLFWAVSPISSSEVWSPFLSADNMFFIYSQLDKDMGKMRAEDKKSIAESLGIFNKGIIESLVREASVNEPLISVMSTNSWSPSGIVIEGAYFGRAGDRLSNVRMTSFNGEKKEKLKISTKGWELDGKKVDMWSPKYVEPGPHSSEFFEAVKIVLNRLEDRTRDPDLDKRSRIKYSQQFRVLNFFVNAKESNIQNHAKAVSYLQFAVLFCLCCVLRNKLLSFASIYLRR